MEIIFEVREQESGGFVARAPGYSIVAEALTWQELRGRVKETVNHYFRNSPQPPDSIWLHLVKDDLVRMHDSDPAPTHTDASWIRKLEPERITPPELAGVVAELSSREPIFHRPEFGTSRAEFDRLMASDYWETGASGRRYAREPILDEMDRRYASGPYEDVWETSDFHCRQLADNVYLLTYTLLQDKQRLTRRTTIWQRTPDGWKIVYHQGTIVQDA